MYSYLLRLLSVDCDNISLFILVRLVLDWLNLPTLRDLELERIAREYDQSTPWTENDEYEKYGRFKEPPSVPPVSSTSSINNNGNLLSTQIAYKQKQSVKLHLNTNQHSTPLTSQSPKFNHKLSPIESRKRSNTQIFAPIEGNSLFNNQIQVKHCKIDDSNLSEFSSIKRNINEEICLTVIDDIEEDDLKF